MKKIKLSLIKKVNLLIVTILGLLGIGSTSCNRAVELEPVNPSDTLVHCMYGVDPAPIIDYSDEE